MRRRKIRNMKKIEFKQLYPEQIEVRPAEVNKDSRRVTLLLYIDSRCAANILNEAVGEFNWQMEYKDVAGQIYGRLSIWDEDREIWVYKEDTGEESNISAAKGLSSDILKRCLARWGCDYLYTAPKIKIKAPDNYFLGDKMTMTFYVKSIEYYDRRISSLTIADRFDNVVFDWKINRDSYEPEEIRFQARKQEETDEQRRLGQLQAWYDGKVKDPSYNRVELDKFKAYFTKQAATFRYKNMDCDLLWTKWVRRMRAS